MANANREQQLVSEDLMYHPDLMAQEDLRLARNAQRIGDLRSSNLISDAGLVSGYRGVSDDIAVDDGPDLMGFSSGAEEDELSDTYVDEYGNLVDESGESYEPGFLTYNGDLVIDDEDEDYYDEWNEAMADREDEDDDDEDEDVYIDENGNRVDEYGQPIDEDLDLSSEALGMGAESFVAQQATGKLLASAWLNLIDTFGLTLIWINIHAFINFAFGDRWFCNLGNEWILKMPKGSKGVFKQIQQASATMRIVETIGLIMLDFLIFFLILALLVLLIALCYFMLYPLTAGWEFVKGLF